MSIMPSSAIPARRWLQLWPLAFLGVAVAAALYGLWLYWPQVLGHAVGWQYAINQQLSELLRNVARNPGRAGWSLLSFSFIYGILHALGPGHGKIVITTWLATHPAKIKHSLRITFAASLIQGLVAIALVFMVLTLLRLPSRQLHLSSFWLEKGSYLLVGGLGLLLCWRALRRLGHLLRRPSRFISFRPHHTHDAHCGCGHQHLPAETQLAAGNSWRTQLLVVLSMGMRPCSGAVMVLLFSKVVGVFGWGMFSALAMAAGTSLTISALALMVHSCRALAVRLSGQRAPVLWRQIGWSTLALAGGMILVAAAWVMWLSAQPPGQGLRPF